MVWTHPQPLRGQGVLKTLATSIGTGPWGSGRVAQHIQQGWDCGDMMQYGHGSIPLNTMDFGDGSSINPSYFDVSRKAEQGFLTHPHVMSRKPNFRLRVKHERHSFR